MGKQFASAIAIAAVLTSSLPARAAPWINEFHYDNVGTDIGEFIEIAGETGTDLSQYQLVRYNGSTPGAAIVYTSPGSFNLSGVIGNQSGNGFGTLSFSSVTDSIQNGGNDGFALVGPGNSIVQLLSYEGIFTASNGPAAGLTSADIGRSETSSTPVGFSLQLTGSGRQYSDFTWAPPQLATAGLINTGQTFSDAPPPPPPPTTAIYTIQGAGHASALAGQTVTTTGIVTQLASNGYYVQDPTGDGNASTSDAIFVFTGSAPGVSVGDSVRVNGAVSEFQPGGATTNNLTTTEITSPVTTILSSGNTLPAATVIGQGGRVPPTGAIDSDNFASFNPNVDGIDFYESLEGMRVTVNNGAVVGPTNNFGEIWLVGDNGANATNRTARGGVLVGPGDYNPERIQIDDGSVGTPNVNVGDRINSVTGVVGYNFGNYEILASNVGAVASGGLQREVTSIPSGGDRLTVANFNLENFAGTDQQSRFDTAAGLIVNNLRAPDIIALQEIQDNNGTTNNGVVDATTTLNRLVAAIAAAGGPTYEYRQVNPVDGTTGGAPGGNIRNGYLVRTDRGISITSADLAPGSANNPAFTDSRRPLVLTISFNGQQVTLINNHFTSKGGSSPIFGDIQPFTNGGEDRRQAQAEFVRALVAQILSGDADANVIVLGDLNEFSFNQPLVTLRGTGAEQLLFDLADTLLPENERYSYVFDGNSQELDHLLVSQALLAAGFTEYDIVHINAEFFDQFSDHDPSIASFLIRAVVPAPESGLLLLTGLVALGGLRRRRRPA